MQLYSDLLLTPTEEKLLTHTISLYQEALIRLYDGSSDLFKTEKNIIEVLKNYEFQVSTSDEFLKFQGYLEVPSSLNTAEKMDLLVLKVILGIYKENLGEIFDMGILSNLIQKLEKHIEHYRNLEIFNTN